MLNSVAQITCLYDMDIPRPDNFNECYLYEGMDPPPAIW
jgi:ATP-dependent RNA helicase DDX18/HAS1